MVFQLVNFIFIVQVELKTGQSTLVTDTHATNFRHEAGTRGVVAKHITLAWIGNASRVMKTPVGVVSGVFVGERVCIIGVWGLLNLGMPHLSLSLHRACAVSFFQPCVDVQQPPPTSTSLPLDHRRPRITTEKSMDLTNDNIGAVLQNLQ